MKKVKDLQSWVDSYRKVENAVDELAVGWDFIKEGIIEEAELDQLYAQQLT